ncbi:probable proline--tRNA ligase, mitochondrial [Euwallacea fornicatus]|uniref:probable proline--tRNA ligase, mitochondrial n=1 Tax=Euwallacea fornicatus TaxID=995702 RepID=UPI003390155E
MNRFSKVFQPITTVSKGSNLTNKEFISKSQRLMLEVGIIHQALPGCFHILPLGLKSLNKIINIVDEEMENIGCQKIILPTLVKAELWEKSGRAGEMGSELITLNDRHNQKNILGPTHEEVMANLISTLPPFTYKKFPLLLYQITSKFRDEMKPRFGLIRAREFLMKDLYSFALNEKSALETYHNICDAYHKVFKRVGVNFVKVLGSSGAMGGNLSHEYHFPATIGDDKIVICHKCNHASNIELSEDNKCIKCGESKEVTMQNAIEVGHTFFLGDKYSKPLKANYLDKHAKPQVLQMGSYGIGITRILAASLECLSLEQELRWPDSIAPYNLVIIPPKKGSTEDSLLQNLGETLYRNLESLLPSLKNNIILDDRTGFTIGRRVLECRRTGIRYIVVLNRHSNASPPIYEFNDIVEDKKLYLNESDIVSYIVNNRMEENPVSI